MNRSSDELSRKKNNATPQHTKIKTPYKENIIDKKC